MILWIPIIWTIYNFLQNITKQTVYFMRVKRLVAFNGGSFFSALYTQAFRTLLCILFNGGYLKDDKERERDRFIVNPCDCEILGWIYPLWDCVIT